MTDSDRAFGRLVVEQGLATPAHVEECLRLLPTLSPRPALGELLVQKGYLTRAQVLILSPDGPAGERFGKYVRTEKLGAGGMGEVWKAWDTELRRWVALKFLIHQDPEDHARFRREAQAAAQLSHPNIGAIHEAGENYIAMQYVAGQTLGTYPRHDKRALVGLIRDAALAVHHAHERGIIHRDLKPENLMVEKGRVFVMDFGLAKSMAAKTSISGTIVGTPAYMSPEQAKGSSAIDTRTDVYSMGATLYELLADRPPFRDAEVYSLLRKVIEEEPKPIAGDLGTIVMKCLEKEPSRRYATAQALAEDLTRYLEGEAILAHPPSTAYRLKKWATRRKAVVIPSAAALVIALVAGFWIAVGAHERKKLTAEVEKETAEKKAAEAREHEERLYSKYEKELAVLTMNFYKPDFRLTDAEFGKYETLEKEIHAQMAETGQSARGWWLIGRAREVYVKWRAEEAYDEALKIDAHHAPSLLRKGRLYLERAMNERAVAGKDKGRQRRAAQLAAEGEEWVRRGLAAAGQKEGMEEDLAAAYLRVVEQWANGTYKSEEMLARWRGRPLVEEFLLLEAISNGSVEMATKVLERVPSYAEAYFWRGGFWNHRGDASRAMADWDKAIEIDPRLGAAYLDRGVARQAKGDLDGAVADFTKAIEIDPRYAATYLDRGVARQDRGDLDGAIEDYTRAIQIDSRYANARYNRGNARKAKGEFDGAIEDYTKAIEIDPRYALAYTNRGVARHAKGDLDRAIEDYGKAIEIDPTLTQAYFNRGLACQGKADLDGAIADLTRAIEIDPRLAEAYGARGHARQQKGDVEGAIADFEKALEVAPANWPHRERVEKLLQEAKKRK